MHDEGENIVQEKGKKTQKGLFTLHKTYRKYILLDLRSLR